MQTVLKFYLAYPGVPNVLCVQQLCGSIGH